MIAPLCGLVRVNGPQESEEWKEGVPGDNVRDFEGVCRAPDGRTDRPDADVLVRSSVGLAAGKSASSSPAGGGGGSSGVEYLMS